MSACVAGLPELVARAWCEVLHLPHPDLKQSWAQAGGDSLATLHLRLRLEHLVGRSLPYDVLTPEMRFADLLSVLTGAASEIAPSLPVVHLIPGVLGDEPRLAAFRRALIGSVRFHVMELAGLEHPAKLLCDVRRTGAHAAARIARRQPQGRVLLAGYSFGGNVAYEAARCLVESGRDVALLAILDSAFGIAVTGALRDAKQRQRWRLRSALRLAASPDAMRRLLLRALSRLPPRLAHPPQRILSRLFREYALHAWRPSPLAIDTLLAVSAEFAQRTMPRWQRLCARLSVIQVPGTHVQLFDAPGAAPLFDAFDTAVKRACAPPSRSS